MVLEKVYDELYSMIEDLKRQIGGGVGASVDYDTDVTNRPKVNNITLSGNKKSSDLKIAYNMTEDDYEEVTPNAESIYCLQENESTSHIDATTDAATLTWVQDGGVYTSTYLIRMDNAVEITVTVDVPEGVTYEVTGSGIDRTITFATETDPAEITGDFTIEADSVNDIGATRIVKNGIEFGRSAIRELLYSADSYSATCALTKEASNYDALYIVADYTITNVKYHITAMINVDDLDISCGFGVSEASCIFVNLASASSLAVPLRGSVNPYISAIYGIKF